MLKKALAIGSLLTTTFAGFSQDSTAVKEPFLEISGSVDAYYKYDFSKTANIPTSFASDQNSLSLGMIDVLLKKSTGKASFVGELSFGPRGQSQSIPDGSFTPVFDDDGDVVATGASSFHIQNLYVNYALSDKFTLTAGYMGTFVGYEVISPVPNFNYSTSYLFTNGPFQNAGIKGTYAFSDKVSLMAGLFNDWNTYSDANGVSHFGAQLMVAPAEGWSAYFNVLTGQSAGGSDTYGSGTILDLTTAYQISDNFKIGLNAADYSLPDDNGGYSGAALYLQGNITPGFGLGLRSEYFKYKDVGSFEGTSVTAFTLSGNLKAGGLTFIPEIRFDNSSEEVFFDADGASTKGAAQFVLAAVYAF